MKRGRPGTAPPPRPGADAADRAIALVAGRFYAAFDNRGGRAPDADALRRLFIPQALIVQVARGGVETMTLESFLAPRLQMLSDGTLEEFHEWEAAASTTRWGDIASRRSTYRKSGRRQGRPYEGRGRKLIQLVSADGSWRIASVLWQDDRLGAPPGPSAG